MFLPLFSGALCKLDSSPHSRTGGNTYQNALGACDTSACCESVLVLNGNDLVVDLGVEGLRNEACADTLDLVRAGLASEEPGSSSAQLQRP